MTIRIAPEGKFGVVDGLSFARSRSIADQLDTEIELKGNRIRFIPTRHALDTLLLNFGSDVFDVRCRVVWGEHYSKPVSASGEFAMHSPPFKHQYDVFDAVKDREFFALEWEMGLGKSKTILDINAFAHANGHLDGLLVVSKKDVHRKWIVEELPKHFPKARGAFWRSRSIESGMWVGPDSRNRTSIVKADGFVVAAINYEAIHRDKGRKFCERFLRERCAGMVLDESQAVKNPATAAAKACLKLGKLARRRWIASGTVSTGSTLDPWAQYSFLSPSIVQNKTFHQWKLEFTVEEPLHGKTYVGYERDPDTGRSRRVSRPVMKVVGYKNEHKLRELLDPFRSRLLKEDCLDLPQKLYRLRSFMMTDNQRAAYSEMAQAFLVEHQRGDATAVSAMAALNKLQQITCGFIILDDGTAVPLDENNRRVEILLEEIEKAAGKVIIWSYFRRPLADISAALRRIYGVPAVVEYHGGIGPGEKAAAIRRFATDQAARFFVGNPMSAGVGLDLEAASDMFYFNNSFNLALRLQSEDRFHRIGQAADTCTITDIECLGTVDRPQLAALRAKREVAASVSGDTLAEWLTQAI